MKHSGQSKYKICYHLKSTAKRIKANPSAAVVHYLCSAFSISLHGLNRFHPSNNEKRHRFTQKSREGQGFSNLLQRYAFILLDCHVETALFSQSPFLKLKFIFLILKAMTGKKRINAFKN